MYVPIVNGWYLSLTRLLSYDCNGTGAQNWVLNAGQTAVQLAGTNFCLDAGSSEYSLHHRLAKPKVMFVRSSKGRADEDLDMLLWSGCPDVGLYRRSTHLAIQSKCVPVVLE